MMIHKELLEQLEQKRKERDLQIKAMTRRAKVDISLTSTRGIGNEIEFTKGGSEGLNFMSNLTLDNAIASPSVSTKSINKSSNTLSSKSLSDPSSNNIILSQTVAIHEDDRKSKELHEAESRMSAQVVEHEKILCDEMKTNKPKKKASSATSDLKEGNTESTDAV